MDRLGESPRPLPARINAKRSIRPKGDEDFVVERPRLTSLRCQDNYPAANKPTKTVSYFAKTSCAHVTFAVHGLQPPCVIHRVHQDLRVLAYPSGDRSIQLGPAVSHPSPGRTGSDVVIRTTMTAGTDPRLVSD